MNMNSSSQTSQRTVSSILAPLSRQLTMRLTAMGGVNWPRATLYVITTPNHTRSHSKVSAIGTNSGQKIRKMEMPSRNMPTITRNTIRMNMTPSGWPPPGSPGLRQWGRRCQACCTPRQKRSPGPPPPGLTRRFRRTRPAVRTGCAG